MGLVLLAPLAPAPTGNGLAMRTDLFRRAAESVHTIVVPVGGQLPDGARAAPHVTVGLTGSRADAMALVADPVWRDRLARAGELPPRTASPALVEAVTSAVADARPTGLHVMRSYLAPLGAAVAERLEVEWTTLDLDEDEGAASDRMLGVFAPLFGGLSAASAVEAEAIGGRLGLDVTHIPNAVDVPARSERRSDGASLLFVGNLTYPPNVAAALTLVHDVLPQLGRARVTIAGPHDGSLAGLAGPHVEVTGFIPDLGAVYASADVVVVPLRTGAGTRIKLLEAFAHGVPVVASPVAAAGLDVRDGEHLLVAEGVGETVSAIERLLADPALAQRLAGAAYELVLEQYATDVVIRAIREFYSRTSPRSASSASPARASDTGGADSP